MEILRISPGRAAWIVTLALLGWLAPRVTRHASSPTMPGGERAGSDSHPISWGLSPSTSDPADTLKPTEDLFESTSLPRLRIHIAESQMAILRRYHWQWGGNTEVRPDARASVYEGGVVYTNVAVHLKGSAGSFRPVDDKPALTLNFDKFAPGQRFHGLKKIHLNNSVQDGSYIAEQISRELCLAAGVPTTRATQAKVELNGRNLGVYVLIEGWNKQFLKQHFKDSNGTLYDGGFAREITGASPLEVMSGDESGDRSDLLALSNAARDPDFRQRLARLDRILDVDRFLSCIAMEILLAHWDGYAMNRNNYRIYHNPESDKLVFMPHGMDQMFGSWSSRPDSPITPPMKGLVARALLQTPEGRARYLDRVGQLYTNVYKTDLILKRVDELSARVRPLVAEGGLWATPGHVQAVSSLRQRIAQRGRSIQAQLALRQAPLQFSRGGEVKLTQWKPRAEQSNASYAESRGPAGQRWLGIKLRGSGTGSWRTKVMLEPGEYQFKGLVRVAGFSAMEDDERSGVGLRLSGGQISGRLLKDSDWTEVSYEFEVAGATDFELICECRGLLGEVTFDADSLRLIRR